MIENFRKGVNVLAEHQPGESELRGIANIGRPVVDEQDLRGFDVDSFFFSEVGQDSIQRKVFVLPGETRTREAVEQAE